MKYLQRELLTRRFVSEAKRNEVDTYGTGRRYDDCAFRHWMSLSAPEGWGGLGNRPGRWGGRGVGRGGGSKQGQGRLGVVTFPSRQPLARTLTRIILHTRTHTRTEEIHARTLTYSDGGGGPPARVHTCRVHASAR